MISKVASTNGASLFEFSVGGIDFHRFRLSDGATAIHFYLPFGLIENIQILIFRLPSAFPILNISVMLILAHPFNARRMNFCRYWLWFLDSIQFSFFRFNFVNLMVFLYSVLPMFLFQGCDGVTVSTKFR